MIRNSSNECSRIILALIIVLFAFSANAQSPFTGLESLFTLPENYVVYHTADPPVIDGNINKLVWQRAPWTNDFVDIQGSGKPKPTFSTRVKMLWDDSCLYIAAQIAEPQVWATLKNHDDIVFHDNDFEVFIDPANTAQPYFEIEINALGTIFDLLLNKPYRDGGMPFSAWDMRDLRSAVKIQGTLNDASDQDEGWTVEMALPFKSVALARLPVPAEGALWRINFSRVEWDTKVLAGGYAKLKDSTGKPLPEHNWVWSPQGLINMHYPERWGYLQFSRQPVNSVTFNLPYPEYQKQYLWLIYYRQKQWYHVHHHYAATLGELGLQRQASIGKRNDTLQLQGGGYQFLALITDSENKVAWTINQQGLVAKLNIQPDE